MTSVWSVNLSGSFVNRKATMNAVTYTSGQAVIQPNGDTAEMRASVSFVGWRPECADLVSEAGKGPSR